jgi:hypothetical protein
LSFRASIEIDGVGCAKLWMGVGKIVERGRLLDQEDAAEADECGL